MAQEFLVYRVWYDDVIAYVGRTKQTLQSRMRGHLFHKPFHKPIDYNKVTKIEYAVLPSEADMNLYEIYYILKWHPMLNLDDKAPDNLTVSLPELTWTEWSTHLWEKWGEELKAAQKAEELSAKEKKTGQQELLRMNIQMSELKRRFFKEHAISKEEFEAKKDILNAKIQDVKLALGRIRR